MSQIGLYLGSHTDTPENIEEVLYSWCQYLSNHEIEVFGSTKLPKKVDQQRDVKHIELEQREYTTPFGKMKTAFQHTSEYCDKRNPDILFQFWTYATHAPGVTFAGRKNSVPVVVRFTGDLFSEYRGYTGIKKLGVFLLNNCLGRVPLRLAAHIIALGPKSKSSIIDRGGKKTDITLIPPPSPDEEQFNPVTNSQEYKEQLGIESSNPVGLYVGRVSAQKGISFLIDVIEKTLKKTDYTFVIVGKGSMTEKIRDRFSEDDVKLPGYVDHSKVDLYYKAADVYLHPSPYEGIPLVILEALQSQVPVVAREAGDINLVTQNVVNTPSQMANLICSARWEDEWLNKHLFTRKYQKESLYNIIHTLG
jgi:glycosyltransferase involved in cell wall biosynthesis